MSGTTFNINEESSSTEPRDQVAKIIERARSIIETNIPEGLELVSKGIALLRRDSEIEPLDVQVAELLHIQGSMYLNQADYRGALVSYSKSREIYEALGDLYGCAV